MLINRVSPCFSWQLCWWSFNLCTEGAPGTARQYKAESFCLSCQTNRRTVRRYDVLHRQYRNYTAQVVVQFDYQQANFSARKKDLHWTAGFKRDSSWIWKRNQMNPSWMSLVLSCDVRKMNPWLEIFTCLRNLWRFRQKHSEHDGRNSRCKFMIGRRFGAASALLRMVPGLQLGEGMRSLVICEELRIKLTS